MTEEEGGAAPLGPGLEGGVTATEINERQGLDCSGQEVTGISKAA